MNIPDLLQADNRARLLRIQNAICFREYENSECDSNCKKCILDADLDVFGQWLKGVIEKEKEEAEEIRL